MREKCRSEMTRRGLLTATGRWLGLAVIGGWLAHTALSQTAEGRTVSLALCGQCPALPRCDKPGVVRVRDSLGGLCEETGAGQAGERKRGEQDVH